MTPVQQLRAGAGMSEPLAAHPLDAERLPVSRNPDGTYSDDLAAMLDKRGYTIRQWREASRCEACGHCEWNPDTLAYDTVDAPCPHGCCIESRCANCGHSSGGVGPVDCECCE